MTIWHQLFKLWYGWGEKEIEDSQSFFFFFFALLQANSYTVSSVSAPSWLHRFIIGKKGQNLAKITQQMPKVSQFFPKPSSNSRDLFFLEPVVDVLLLLCLQVHIEFTEGEDKITLEGPTKDVQMVQSQIEAIVTDLVSVELPEPKRVSQL